MGRSAILGEQRNNYFCDVGCGRGEMVRELDCNYNDLPPSGSVLPVLVTPGQ